LEILASNDMGLPSDLLQLELASSTPDDAGSITSSVPLSSTVIHAQSSVEANAISTIWASEPVEPEEKERPMNIVASADFHDDAKLDAEIAKICHGLTAQQLAIVLIHVDYFKARQKDPNAKPPNILMLGGPGTGKSYVIEATVSKIVPLFPLLGAAMSSSPFGGAAALLKNGRTTHSLCMFTPPGARGGNGNNSPLKDQLLAPLSAKNLLICGARLGISSDGRRPALIVVDEVSLFSAIGLCHMHQRLCQLTGSLESFGGLPILLSGDLRQIDPVGGIPLYQDAIFDDELDVSKPSSIGTKEFMKFKVVVMNEQKPSTCRSGGAPWRRQAFDSRNYQLLERANTR
jgi:hypothetical protein